MIWLWVDDERKPPDAHWRWAKNENEAIAILETNQVAFVSLDHDFGPPENGNGYRVACWIEEMAANNDPNAEPIFNIPHMQTHSMNPAGREKIVRAIRKINAIAGR